MRQAGFVLRGKRFGRLALILLPLAACATPKAGGYEVAEADRWQGTNRKIYNFNKGLDRAVLKPAANAYRTVVPTAARHGIANVFSNYGEPANMLNAILQGKISQAFRSFDRLLVNSTIGVGGLADNATDLGRPEEPEDFGQTFAAWGIESGPYVVVPVFGPSTVRDSFGLAADFAFDPADYIRNAVLHPSIYWKAGQIITRLVDFRARTIDLGADAVLADSLDEYTLLKSVYLQNRRNAIYDGNPPPLPGEMDDGSEEVPPPPAATAAPPPPQ
jgi:phospholipid-binding lipoprotein MlaA